MRRGEVADVNDAAGLDRAAARTDVAGTADGPERDGEAAPAGLPSTVDGASRADPRRAGTDRAGPTVDALLSASASDPAGVKEALQEARRRTWALVEGLADEDLGQAAASYLSPPVWDLGHIANFEEQWLVQRLQDAAEMRPGYNDTYDAFSHPRPERPQLHLLDRAGARRYMEDVRTRALQVLAQVAGDGGAAGGAADRAGRLVERLFVHWMIVLHEHQHQETLLQSIAMRGPARYRPPHVRPLPAPQDAEPQAWVAVPAGPFSMGAAPGPRIYDNESSVHVVDVPAFEIQRYPVTCGAYLAFMDDGGYTTTRWWSDRGRAWLDETAHHAPLHWSLGDGRWTRATPAGEAPVAQIADEILCHVTFHEAEAYAAWAGARLPTEAEWEKACRWRPPAEGAPPSAGAPEPHEGAPDAARGPHAVGRNPWGDAPAHPGRANVDQLAFRPSRVGSHPGGRSWAGCEHMIGDVWEWCSSGFEAYPGFEAFPYREYSEVFFGGDYRMLRGGSWATRAGCATGTFRNWDHPYRRQIFSGIRLARDA